MRADESTVLDTTRMPRAVYSHRPPTCRRRAVINEPHTLPTLVADNNHPKTTLSDPRVSRTINGSET